MTPEGRKEVTDALNDIIKTCDEVIPGSRFEAFLEGGEIAVLRPETLKEICTVVVALMEQYARLKESLNNN